MDHATHTAAEQSVTARSLHRDPAVIVGFLVITCGVALIPFGHLALPVNPSFMPAFGAVTVVVDLVTSLILFSQARAERSQSTSALGIAYLFSAVTIIPHLAAFPGVFVQGSLIGASVSAVWLWCVWHGGFAICVARYAIVSRHDSTNPPARSRPVIWPYVALTIAVAVASTMMATAGLPYLPEVLVGSGFARLNAMGIGPAVLLANVTALALVVTLLRGRSVMARWLAVAMSAATLDVVLTLLGNGRFTLGWYAARGLSLVTGVVVLVALLHELTSLFARTAEANRRLEALSLTDGLTGLPNRRAFDQAMDAEWRSARRQGDRLALLMIDIDHFKSFNDRFGHPVGDLCLRIVAEAIGSLCQRGRDLGARFGGEEFAVLLPSADERGAQVVAEIIRAQVAALTLEQNGQSYGKITVSIGFALWNPAIQRGSMATFVSAADQALYLAKRGGRNCVVGAEASARAAEPENEVAARHRALQEMDAD